MLPLASTGGRLTIKESALCIEGTFVSSLEIDNDYQFNGKFDNDYQIVGGY